MGMYGPPPQHMQMYPRMPYPTHQGMPNGYPQQLPGGDGLQQQQPQPGMYPPHPSQQQMYGQQQQQLPQGWNPQMMRPPMPSQPPPQGYPGQPPQQQPGQGPLPPQQQQQQPGQSSHEFWQHQQRAAMAAAAAAQQQQQQQQSQGQKKPPYFPSNQPPPQASPQPSQRGQQGHQTPNNSSSTIPPPPPQQQTPIQQPKMLPPQQPQPGPSHQQQQQQTPQLPPSQHHHRQMGMQQPGPSQQQLQPQHAFLQQHLPPPPIVFPPNCVEAIALQHLGPQKRPAKKLSKDLISATSRRIYMALKSNIHMEIIWALNSLTVMLYDDTITPPTLSTEILNIIIEHFRASLSLVFPKAFPLEDPAAMDTSESTKIETKTFWEQIIFDAEKSGETIKTKVE
uniref:Uncharacterized protein n=1 Tax=Panagrolaimus superbus TaxID=310955 RepID=A0A914Y385_9BILA